MALLIIIICFVIFSILFGVYQKCTNAVCTSKKRLDGKTALVTGGTSGIGLEIAKDFAGRGARVIVACPYEEEGRNGLRNIVKSTGNTNVVFKLLDLASFESTRRFAADILKREARIDILINNAGVVGPFHGVSADGLNIVMQINYYGAFLLTMLLLPLLKKTGTREEPSRIVNMSSVAHIAGRLKVNSDYNIPILRCLCYPDSKMALIAFAQEFKSCVRNSNVVMNSVEPGIVATPIYRTVLNVYFVGRLVTFICYYFFKTAREGAQTAIKVALESRSEVTGKHFRNCHPANVMNVHLLLTADGEKLLKRYWEDSIRIVKLTDKELDIICFE